jgi:glutaredoxin-like protein
MGLISDKDAEVLRREFEARLANPVRLLMFTQTLECQFCKEARQIVEEVASLSDRITAEIHNFVLDKAVADLYAVDKIPAIAIMRVEDGQSKDYGIRFYGMPSGYEFASLIEDIIDVSVGQTGLKAKTKEKLAAIKEPVHLQVFVTPTCPYCPQAVRLAHQFAIENEFIRADMIEAIEFPHLANKYGVRGVPQTVINESVHQEGAVPEPMMLARLLEALELIKGQPEEA